MLQLPVHPLRGRCRGEEGEAGSEQAHDRLHRDHQRGDSNHTARSRAGGGEGGHHVNVPGTHAVCAPSPRAGLTPHFVTACPGQRCRGHDALSHRLARPAGHVSEQLCSRRLRLASIGALRREHQRLVGGGPGGVDALQPRHRLRLQRSILRQGARASTAAGRVAAAAQNGRGGEARARQGVQ